MNEKNVFRDCYNLFEKYSNVQSDQAYWSELIEAAEQIEMKHERDHFTVVMLKVVLDRLVELADERSK